MRQEDLGTGHRRGAGEAPPSSAANHAGAFAGQKGATMIEAEELVIDGTRRSRTAMQVTARLGDVAVHLDSFDVTKAEKRRLYVEQLIKKVPGADPEAVEAELVALASEADPPTSPPYPEGGGAE